MKKIIPTILNILAFSCIALAIYLSTQISIFDILIYTEDHKVTSGVAGVIIPALILSLLVIGCHMHNKSTTDEEEKPINRKKLITLTAVSLGLHLAISILLTPIIISLKALEMSFHAFNLNIASDFLWNMGWSMFVAKVWGSDEIAIILILATIFISFYTLTEIEWAYKNYKRGVK